MIARMSLLRTSTSTLVIVVAWHSSAPNACAQYQGGTSYTPTYTYGTYPPSGFGSRAPNKSFNGGFSGLGASPQYQQQRTSYAAPQTGTSTMAGLEEVLNQVDNSNWNNVPVSGRTGQPGTAAAASMSSTVPKAYAGPSALNNAGGMFPKISRQEMVRIFFDGGSAMGVGGGGAAPLSANSTAATSTAYSNYQTACNEETKSRNYANTARYDGSKWNRKNAAEQAEYAANNANYAAQRAESAAYNGDSQARGYANLAREAANRARENANQARYNADTIP